MASVQSFLEGLNKYFSAHAGSTSFIFTLLLIGLEALTQMNLSCPCSYGKNMQLITLIFIGPFVFTFMMMFIVLRPCKKTRLECLEQIAHCLCPPVIWIIILLIDGDYLACSFTSWEGDYIFNEEINRKWCKPTKNTNKTKETIYLHDYKMFICTSQIAGYSVALIISLIIIVILSCFDCCNWKKGEDGSQIDIRPLVEQASTC